ncbi:alpha/beta-hydrolase [Xylariomycetidae sp. FL2044]|nr:alpha/beta-hydrolase [Xylariomycetidae sp. FL2044]
MSLSRHLQLSGAAGSRTRASAAAAAAASSSSIASGRPLVHESPHPPAPTPTPVLNPIHIQTSPSSPFSTATTYSNCLQPCTFYRTSIGNHHRYYNKLSPTNKHTATMSTMPAQHGHSKACCNVPPVVSKGYDPKGSYEELGGYKTYVTGPKEATKGIIHIYDIFGYYPQTLQGADILATSDDAQKYLVFMPDWFRGSPCPLEWFPPDTPEKQKSLGEFFQKNPPPGVAEQVPAYVKAASARYPQVKDWAIIGFCWGGKVVSLVTSSPDNIFKAGVECHPAMVDPAEADKIKVPLLMLASKDEPPEDVKKFEQGLKHAPKRVEIFGDQIHGWMAARSDLDDPRVKEEYTRGYQIVLEFLSEHV